MKIDFAQRRPCLMSALMVALSCSVLLAGSLAAQEKSDAAKKDADKPEKKAKQILAITGGDIHTVTNGVIRNGTVIIEDDKIKEVGTDVGVPEGATVIDATGKIVSPGFVSISMSRIGFSNTPSGNNKLADSLDPFDQNMKYALGVGITSGCVELTSSNRGRRGRSEDGVQESAQAESLDQFPGEPQDRFPGLEQPIEERLTEEMLDFGNLDTAKCPCCGLPVLPTEPITPARPTAEQPRTMTVVKLAYGNLDSMLAKEDVFYSPAPGALNGALNRHNWRVKLDKAKKAIEEEKAKANGDDKEKKESDDKAAGNAARSGRGAAGTRPGASRSSSKDKPDPEVIKLLKGETRMRVTANAFDEINDLTDLALEYGYGLVIEGGVEAWALADKLSEAGVEVIYTPRNRREPQPGREDNSGSNFESPEIFENKGIPFATKPLSNSVSMNGLAGRDLTSLPLEAAFAVRGGATEKAALESLTIVPARMMGMEDRVGSIEAGKDADLLILTGTPLDYKTYVDTAIVSGKVAYDRDEDRVYPVFDR